MSVLESLELGRDEFAFHFDTNVGVEADALANFLKRAATFARRQGGEIRIVGLHEGSLTVRIKAIKKSKVAQNAKREFVERPIDSSVKVSPFVAALVWAIVKAMSPEQSDATPIAKAGAEVIENHAINQISIITNENQIIVMDEKIASEVRSLAHKKPQAARSVQELPQVSDYGLKQLSASALYGTLKGQFVLVDREHYFRPDGYHYLVPLDSGRSYNSARIDTGSTYVVSGKIGTLDGQPDNLIIYSATKVEDGSQFLQIGGP